MTDALDFIRRHTDLVPEVALVLGSGLGALADEVEDAVTIPTGDIPGCPVSTVAGHAGRLVFGRLEGRPVLVIQGRVHVYEGYGGRAVGFPIRLAHALGAKGLVLTNAAGGINADFGPGTLMLITDHLNMTSVSPLTGPTGAGETRFPDMSDPYDAAWRTRAVAVAERLGVPMRQGVYAFTTGPSYETPAEIRFFRLAGGDAVGMSTVPETIQAAALGMPVLGLSTITNAAAGMSGEALDHNDVLAVGQRVRESLSRLVRGIVAEGMGD